MSSRGGRRARGRIRQLQISGPQMRPENVQPRRRNSDGIPKAWESGEAEAYWVGKARRALAKMGRRRDG